MPWAVMLKKPKLNRPTRLSRTNTQKRCPFHYRGLECKARSQEIPGVTGKFGLGVQNETGQRLIEFCQENALITPSTHFQQHRRSLYTWASSDGQYRNQIVIFFCNHDGEALYNQQKQDRNWLWLRSQIPIAKFRLKFKKAGKTTRPFRYDINQIPCNYPVEVTNRLKGLDLIDRVSEELWKEVRDIVQKCKKAKWLSEEALKIAVIKEKQKAKEKRKVIPIWM